MSTTLVGPRPLKTVAQTCPLCGLSSTTTVARASDFEFGSSPDEWNYKRCLGCDVLYLDPRPDVCELDMIYPSNYYTYTFSEHRRSLVLKGKSLVDRTRVRRYLRHVGGRQGNILDVGCGDGHLLRLFEAEGIARTNLFGIDVKDEAVEVAQSQGYAVTAASIDLYPMPAGRFSLIVMNQVVEHLVDPKAVVAKCAQGLEPGGVFILETPNTRSLDFRLFSRRHWGGYHTPRHWVLFNSESIRRLFDGSGLWVVEVQSLPSPFFWVWSIHHWLQENRGRVLARWFHWRNPALLTLFTLWDLVRMPFFTTSNMRVVAQKRMEPALEPARG